MLSIRKRFERGSVNGPARRTAVKARPCLESLETRVVLYTTTGNAWPHPELITISVMRDGTLLGQDFQGNNVRSNLISTLTSRMNVTQAQLQDVFLKAAQLWAQQTNINFTVIADDGSDWTMGDYQQGDPGVGDIRIGGYDYQNTTLATAYQPPPVTNIPLAGDIVFNTGAQGRVGSPYDLFTIAVHEIGHSLGMGHTNIIASQMYIYYNASKSSLNSDDITGIRSVSAYGGPRNQDAYDAAAANGTFYTATNLNPLIDPTALTALVQQLDITTTADVDYYKFTVPTGTSGTMTLNLQSSGLSLLAPKWTIYNSGLVPIGTDTGTGYSGATFTKTYSVSHDQTFYVVVQGANTAASGTGAYAMTLRFGNTPSPTVPLPQTLTPNGYPTRIGGGLADSLPGPGHGKKHVDGLPDLAINGVPLGPHISTKPHRRDRHSGHRRA